MPRTDGIVLQRLLVQSSRNPTHVEVIDLHLHRSVVVREEEAAEKVGVVRIDNDPLALATLSGRLSVARGGN